jgi:hypothetical protein
MPLELLAFLHLGLVKALASVLMFFDVVNSVRFFIGDKHPFEAR